ncbi:anti-sigma factor [Actinomycetospora corticicola]|uniref:Serine/threonine-protein kinase RsbW n=1 Tax=Actinomycetospora corticicola TaxID=663602 RepID=A0A7Y9DW35_9PSEU|nr:serine/threonine-protein kinase RsbW [Actinomycetospora corticicola]
MDVLQRMGPPPRVSADRPVVMLERTVPADRASASALRRTFRSWLREWADPDTADDLALAVYEALANVVDHAYSAAPRRGEMRLWAAVSPPLAGGRDLVITVSDDGSWRRSTGCGWRGRGLPLMHTLTRATVLSGVHGTTVQLRSRVSP